MSNEIAKKIRAYNWNLVRFGFSASKIFYRIKRNGYPRILINSIPKAGTHLIERAICLIPYFYRKLLPTLNGRNISQYGGYKKVFSRLNNCEVLVAHFDFDLELSQLIKNFQIITVFVIRDPRDVVISKSYYPLTDRHHEFHNLFSGKTEYERIKLAILGNKDTGLLSIKQIFNNYEGWLGSADFVIRFEDIIGVNGGGSRVTQQKVVNDLESLFNIELGADYANNIFFEASPTFRNGQQKSWVSKFDESLKLLFKDIAGDILIKYGYEKNNDW